MKQVDADIGIIAAGPAGLAAAAAAAEKGAKVVVFEKSSVTGGCGNMAMGPFGVESRLQKQQIIDSHAMKPLKSTWTSTTGCLMPAWFGPSSINPVTPLTGSRAWA